MAKEPRKELSADYLGYHVENLIPKKVRKKKFIHPIFIYTLDDLDPENIEKLYQVVNVYEHSLEDFEFNARSMIKHFRNMYGSEISHIGLGQCIRFRVYEGQDPLDLPLFQFFINYTMLIVPILTKCDMKNWTPWVPEKWTASGWDKQMNVYIAKARGNCNMRYLSELIEWSKYLTNLWCAEAGDRLALSISNNDFLEVANRSEHARKLMDCDFDIPENIEPSELEQLKKKETAKLLNIMGEQTDLPISVYARNGLFNPGQAGEFFVLQGYKPDLNDHTIPMTHHTNIIKGLKHPVAFMVDAYGGRKAEVLKLNVSDAGAFERSLTMLLSGVRYVDPDWECDSKHFRIRDIAGLDMLEKLEGRVATLDPKSDEYFIISPDDTNLIGKRLYIKTPITCTHPRRNEGYICSACYGKLMANLNRDIHIGRLAGLNSADEIEQKLLSAKHALTTNTNDIEFNDLFDAYFTKAAGQIRFNDAILEASANGEEHINDLYLEFHLTTMKKVLDGEGRHFDRSTSEIIVYDKNADTRVSIHEENGVPICLSPDFILKVFLPAIAHHNPDEPVLIKFTDIINNGISDPEILFEYQYMNNGIAKPLNTMQDILKGTSRINEFTNYDDLLNTLIPLFVAGGIHLPEFQQELLVSQLICDPKGRPVDWSLEKPEYKFMTIDAAIFANKSPITSVLYHESSGQLSGKYGTYNKCGTSQYDWFIC